MLFRNVGYHTWYYILSCNFQQALQHLKYLTLVFRYAVTLTACCLSSPSTFHIACWFLGAFAKLPKRLLTLSYLFVCLYVCPRGTTRLQVDGFFLQNLIFENLKKKSVKENKRVLFMETYVHF